MSNPAEIAKDDYEALMKGDDKVISGMQNKSQVAISQVMPDTMVENQMRKQSDQVNKPGRGGMKFQE